MVDWLIACSVDETVQRPVFETDGRTMTCSTCGNQYRTMRGILEHLDQIHGDIDD